MVESTTSGDKKDVKQIPMQSLAAAIELAHDENKYCVIFDKNGNCGVFFTYKATMKDFHKDIISRQIGKRGKDEALEDLRSSLVYSQRLGDTFVINCENLNPDFKTDWQDDEVFPLDEISDFENWRKDQNYLKIVKKEENKDLLGNKNMYVMQPSFTMCFLYKYQSEEHIDQVLSNIPGSENMQVLITDPQKVEQAQQQVQKPKYQPQSVKTYSSNCSSIFDAYVDEYDKAEARRRQESDGQFQRYQNSFRRY